ncbi:MAG: acetyl-CoA synthetase, partial [Clostridia bacterium]|nr:acetyl-CoA synthetase [Clostridia bacterium]
MLHLYQRYLDETVDANGVVTDYQLKVPGPFNFAYDVVDAIAKAEPDRRAMHWCNEAGEARTFSFSELKEQSDRTASFFQSLGLKKGDPVMLILKRHYEFWFAILALHKIGAVAIPATNQLQVKDLTYRYQAADIKAVICTGEGEIAAHVDEAAALTGHPLIRAMVHGSRDGWLSFQDGLDRSQPFVQPTGDAAPGNEDRMLLYFTSG